MPLSSVAAGQRSVLQWDVRNSIRFKTWPAVVGGLGCLLLLILVSSEAIRRKAREIYEQLDQMNTVHRNVSVKLQVLRADIHLSGIFVRDYLLDNSHLTAPTYREALLGLRSSTRKTLDELSESGNALDVQRVQNLSLRLDEYWETFDPLFSWTPAQKLLLSSSFLRREVLPRRDAVLDITRDVESFNNITMQKQRSAVKLQEQELIHYFRRMLYITMGLGVAIALAAGIRFHIVETRAENEYKRSEQAESEMRRLSHLLVHAQEEERKNLSRELHDQVGQMLTALRMEVGHAERARAGNGNFSAHVAECKRLIDTIVGTVRDLSMGLRPSMLDDFGLGPALQWHARDFARRYNIPVNVMLEGNLDQVAEPYRTCVYRVVQEALTNCARHSKAKRIDISVDGANGMIALRVRDDGIGMDVTQKRRGIGLLGIQERVRELSGTMEIHSSPGSGTELQVSLPVETLGKVEEIAHPVG